MKPHGCDVSLKSSYITSCIKVPLLACLRLQLASLLVCQNNTLFVKKMENKN